MAEAEFYESDLTENDQKEKVFELEIPLTDAGLTSAYTVRVKADCDLTADGTGTEPQKILAEQTVNAAPRILITDSSADAAYVEKRGSVELDYELSHNVEAELTALVINNLELEARSEQPGVWRVTALLRNRREYSPFPFPRRCFQTERS